MTTYPDLSKYEYTDSPVEMLNVGWLGPESTYAVGDLEPAVREILIRLAVDPKNVMRGLHDCGLCDTESPIRIETPWSQLGRIFLGTGEIHVMGVGGEVYSAPTLVIHYIDVHRYRPPDKFIDAVLRNHDGR